MDETELKRRFAELLAADPANPLKAALSLLPEREDFARAAEIAQKWPKDAEVIALREKTIDDAGGELALLPSEAEYARKVWQYATEMGFPSQERFKFMQLFGEVMGYTGKMAGNDGGNHYTVMLVNNFGSDDDWERELEQQQSELINGEYERKH